MPNMYNIAVYNLGASFLINYGTEAVFAEFRKQYGLNDFKAGLLRAPGITLPAPSAWFRTSSKTCRWQTCRCSRTHGASPPDDRSAVPGACGACHDHLHLGVIDIPYEDENTTTGSVAEELEARYQIMQTFLTATGTTSLI